MKFRYAPLIILTLSFFHTNAQVIDTVSLGANYSNQVYYSLENGIESDVVKNDWDLAFETTPQGYSILINAATGTELYLYPGDTTNFSTLDTAGISTWTQRFNSDTSWGYGAFSQDQSGFSVGWGEYNITTHNIYGDKVFVIKLSNGDYQKIWIKSLAGGKFTFRHAAIVGSMDMVHTLDKAAFTNKNFGYFSLQNHNQVDKEPLAEDWDLYFGQYTAFVPSAYLVAGVLQNSDVKAVKAYPVNDPVSYKDHSAHTFMKEINVLGYDWKTFNMSTFLYEIADSTVYFVKTQDNAIWKVVFTGFGGGTDGNFIFTKELLIESGIHDYKSIDFVEVYPNPASDYAVVNYNSREDVVLTVSDLSGKKLMHKILPKSTMQYAISTSGLQTGLYLLSLNTDKERVTTKLLIK